MKSLLTISLSIWLLFSYQVLSIAQSNKSNDKQTDNESSARNKETKKAVITSKPAPKYPIEGSGEKGIVSVRMIFRASGKITNVEVSKVSPEDLPEAVKNAFIRESIKVADQIKFIPATKEGRPVSQYVLVEYHFSP